MQSLHGLEAEGRIHVTVCSNFTLMFIFSHTFCLCGVRVCVCVQLQFA